MEPINHIRQLSAAIETRMGQYAAPIRPYLPALARFLLVVTFVEDSLRICSQWTDQIYFLQMHRGFFTATAEIFLILNVIGQLAGSFFAVSRQHTPYAVGGLFAVIISQGFGYGMIFDFNFFVRSLSMAGGLLILLADYMAAQRKAIFAGLPTLNDTDMATYLQLLGRILLVLLFLAPLRNSEYSLMRILITLVTMVACIMVAVGFKARYSAWMLVLLLLVGNIIWNNFWELHAHHPQRDFLKYDFFQTLSIVGGFLLLSSSGPGELSVDEQKKRY